MTYHDSLLNRVERLARQLGRNDEVIARWQLQEYEMRQARDRAVREVQELRLQCNRLAAKIATTQWNQTAQSDSTTIEPAPPTAVASEPTPVTEPLDDSSGADGPGQS